MNKNDLAFSTKNYMWLCYAAITLTVGFFLLAGGGTTNPDDFNPEIFSTIRTTVAPAVLFIGYCFVFNAIFISWK